MKAFLNRIDEDLWRSIGKGPYHVDQVQAVGKIVQSEYFTTICLKKQGDDKRCIHELCGLLPLVVYNYIHGSAQEIWNTPKENLKEMST